METKSISILWNNKNDSIENLAEKMFNSMNYLNTYFRDIFGDFYEPGHCISDANQKFIYNEAIIKELISKKIDNNLGVSISFWNGEKDNDLAANFSARIGMSSSNNKLKNNFVIRFPNNDQVTSIQVNDTVKYLTNLWDAKEVRLNGQIINLKNNTKPIFLSEKDDSVYKTYKGISYTKEE